MCEASVLMLELAPIALKTVWRLDSHNNCPQILKIFLFRSGYKAVEWGTLRKTFATLEFVT